MEVRYVKYLSQGATGYIGFNVALAFRRAGYEIWGLTRSREKRDCCCNRKSIRLSAVWTKQKPTEKPRITARCSSIAHQIPEIPTASKTNAARINRICLLRYQHKTVIFTSGVWVYGNTGNKPQDETDRLNPLNLSSWRPGLGVCWSKTTICAASLFVRVWCMKGKTGRDDRHLVSASRNRKSADHRRWQNHWSMVHVDDVASAYVRAGKRRSR